MTCVVTLAIVERRPADDRPRRRQPPVQASPRRHPEAHARPLPGRRARGRAGDQRGGRDAPPAAQRGIPRRRRRAARQGRRGLRRGHRRSRWSATPRSCSAPTGSPTWCPRRRSTGSCAQHAGSPEAVVDALIAAANEAGGRDNVTVVYAEGPDFARAVRGRAPGGGPATAPDAAPPGATATGTSAEPFAEPVENGLPRSAGNPVARFFRWIVRSRTTWFALGAVAGVSRRLLLVWRAAETQPRTARVPSPWPDRLGSVRLARGRRRARPGRATCCGSSPAPMRSG